MAEDRPGAARALGLVNAALCVLVAAALVFLCLVLVQGAKVVPGTTRAERTQQRYDDVRAAATKEIVAFLEVDYKKMDPLIAKVLDGSTGGFKTQYAASKVNLKAAAQQEQATSTGTVGQVGISELKDASATVFVAADAVVTNRSTSKTAATRTCPHGGAVCRFYRLKVGMELTPQGWKMSSLDFVS